MSRPSTWATQVEVYAASSYFQVPLYILSYKSSTEYHWDVFKPISRDKLKFPIVVDSSDDSPQPANKLSHFELVNLRDTHYNSIVDEKSRAPPEVFPTMIPRPLADKTNSSIAIDE